MQGQSMLMLSFIFVSEKLHSNEITLMYCNTCENATDIFTKTLGKIKFELFREMLGVEFNPLSSILH